MKRKYQRFYGYSIVVSVLLVTLALVGFTSQTEDIQSKQTAVSSARVASSAVTIGEVGQITGLTHVAHTQNLSGQYTNPVVFALPPTRNGTNVAVVRITDVQSDEFTVRIKEPPSENGIHGTGETVSYIVLEAGEWELPDGTILEVGTLDTNATVGINVQNSWEQITFSSVFTSKPVALSQVQSNNDSHYVVTRQRLLNTTGFKVALEENEAKTTAHGTETIGWLAIENSTGSWDGHLYEADRTAKNVTHNWTSITFAQSFSNPPRFMANLGSYHGDDNAHLRYQSLTKDGVEVMVEEDTGHDSETTHTEEVVDYLAIEGNGLLTGTSR